MYVMYTYVCNVYICFVYVHTVHLLQLQFSSAANRVLSKQPLLEQPVPASYLKLEYRVREISTGCRADRTPPVIQENAFRWVQTGSTVIFTCAQFPLPSYPAPTYCICVLYVVYVRTVCTVCTVSTVYTVCTACNVFTYVRTYGHTYVCMPICVHM